MEYLISFLIFSLLDRFINCSRLLPKTIGERISFFARPDVDGGVIVNQRPMEIRN